MKRFKEVILKLLFPNPIIIVLSSLIGFSAVIVSFKFLSPENPINYISYVLSAYALMVLCVSFPKVKRRYTELIHGDELKPVVNFRRFMNRYKYTSMYLNDPKFRARVSLYMGLTVNLFYAVFKCFTGAIFRSAWFWAIGLYYVMLSAIRFILLRNVHLTDKKACLAARRIHEYKGVRMCGIMMFALNIAMTAMTVQMIWRNRGYEYKGYIIYISALYAFYSLINAIVNVVKFSKNSIPIFSSAKLISLAGALMSMFTLQTAMFSAFGTNGESYQRMMNAITGGVVCFMVLAMAVFMVVWSGKKLKMLEGGECNG